MKTNIKYNNGVTYTALIILARPMKNGAGFDGRSAAGVAKEVLKRSMKGK